MKVTILKEKGARREPLPSRACILRRGSELAIWNGCDTHITNLIGGIYTTGDRILISSHGKTGMTPAEILADAGWEVVTDPIRIEPSSAPFAGSLEEPGELDVEQVGRAEVDPVIVDLVARLLVIFDLTKSGGMSGPRRKSLRTVSDVSGVAHDLGLLGIKLLGDRVEAHLKTIHFPS